MAAKKTTKTVAKKKPVAKKKAPAKKKQSKNVVKPNTNVEKSVKKFSLKNKKIDWTMWLLIAALVAIIIYYLFRIF